MFDRRLTRYQALRLAKSLAKNHPGTTYVVMFDHREFYDDGSVAEWFDVITYDQYVFDPGYSEGNCVQLVSWNEEDGYEYE